MSTVAEKLRQAREAQHLTVHQVADITKIRTDHIRALEEGNYDVFSAEVYIRGFVRAYGTLLKLDVKELMEALDEELKQTEKFSEPPSLTDQQKGPLDFLMLQFSKIDWRKGAVVLGALVVIGVVLIIISMVRNQTSRDPIGELPPGVYQPSQTNTGETLPVPVPRRP
ncbi:MAG TPA: helix-turn-helix domain-containing protein [Verrucomicrobia bacterium]|nr:helix-turn-helix domain-containing protein [Verrucomicrobiota bacterium]HOB32876.1 helix-turn-helix domain-containing protein [Verrucomicrobiota bacterium]HOP98721.1 helix-turn-helix domain-containing protein [Verrucomicrobiota bacterium]HPU56664.1 helix-turn-helix domain-containing protein [Verrucomicrobiota bacterium]